MSREGMCSTLDGNAAGPLARPAGRGNRRSGICGSTLEAATERQHTVGAASLNVNGLKPRT
jgi:hypothetical protein